MVSALDSGMRGPDSVLGERVSANQRKLSCLESCHLVNGIEE